jgi:hypothetical protein
MQTSKSVQACVIIATTELGITGALKFENSMYHSE